MIKIVKVTSNDSTELIYIPKAVKQALNLRKGTYVKLSIVGKKLVVEPLELERAA
jgi:AbrB family looped-hinge helix DNA binding protein